MSDIDYDRFNCRNDTSEAFVACGRGRCACKEEDMDTLCARVAELKSDAEGWERHRNYAISEAAKYKVKNGTLRSDLRVKIARVAELEAENDRLKRGIGEIGLRFISGNSVPVERTTITLSEYDDWCDRMGLNSEGD